MNVSFDIKCSDYSNQPSYRVWINGELMTERDFVIPSDQFSHYKFNASLDCDSADVRVESITPGVEFAYENLEVSYEDQ